MTYANFMTQAAIECNLDPTNSTQWTAWEKLRICQWLNQGMEELWQGHEGRIWPWLATTDTVTVTSYLFSHTDVENAVLMTVWEADPRSLWAADTFENAASIPWILDDTNGSNVMVQTALASVFVVYTIARPVFVSTSSTTEVVPDDAVRYLLAYIARRNIENSKTSNVEQLLDKAIAREQRELGRMVDQADATWQNAPWLDYVVTYKQMLNL